ncbi:MAG: hypothetical protein AAF353_17150, partial [Pseudomonadota bacterium]
MSFVLVEEEQARRTFLLLIQINLIFACFLLLFGTHMWDRSHSLVPFCAGGDDVQKTNESAPPTFVERAQATTTTT